MTGEKIAMDIDALDLIRLALHIHGDQGYAALVEYDCFRHPSTGATATVEEVKALHQMLEPKRSDGQAAEREFLQEELDALEGWRTAYHAHMMRKN